MQKKIYLIGFMGAGKSTIGHLLSHQLEVPFLDTDDEFARLHNGMTTGEYISTYGIDLFRPEEEMTLRHIASLQQPAVIATGAGVPVYGNNLSIMRQNGMVIHLNVPFEAIESRMSQAELARRPFWTSQGRDGIRKLYDNRLSIYGQAHITIDSNRPPEEVVADIIRNLQDDTSGENNK